MARIRIAYLDEIERILYKIYFYFCARCFFVRRKGKRGKGEKGEMGKGEKRGSGREKSEERRGEGKGGRG